MNNKVFVFSIILSISVFSQNYPPPENVWMYTMCSKIYFGWSMPDSAEISGFRVYHKSDDDTLWSYLMDIDSPTTENIIPDLQQGILERIYNYSIWQNMCLGVSALYPDGKSPITETCMMGVADVWREPPYLRFIEYEIDTVILDWYSGSAGCGDTASHYEVFRKFEDSSWIQIASIPLQQTQYHDLLTKSGKYCYYVTLVTYHRELKSFENLCITVTSVNDDPGMKKGEIYTFKV